MENENIFSAFALAGLVYALYSFNKEKKEIGNADAYMTFDRPNILFGNPKTMTLDDLYLEFGNRYGIDPLLIKAIASIESSENPNAVNPSDPSIGLMQILCIPDGKGGCKNKFNLPNWDRVKENDLFIPEINLQYGVQILKWNIDTYGFKRGIAVYNNWGARNDPEDGPFPNQSYVDKVLTKYNSLR